MASTTNQPSKITRQGSLLGTIKNIVAAPLTWLAGSEHDDSSDSTGKRRRLEPVSESGTTDDGDNATRTKRMRLNSPPKTVAPTAYNDPPSSAFVPLRVKRRTPAPPLARSSSTSANILEPPRNSRRNVSRSTLSPPRIGRTMSMDPPLSQLYISRDASIPDVVMESGQASNTRELSVPAGSLTARPSFRMRTSLTPQPQPRELSEPPPISTLSLNPTFVRPPRPIQEEPKPSTTLGTLVESVRSARSPGRQHSSLLFGNTVQPDANHQPAPAPQAPAEKALYELDVYKTPLIPTRLRSANNPIASSSSDIPSMFKSRRTSQLVLMHDDRRSEKSGKKKRVKSPHRNDAKPYAGSGGMKKLLAKRKKEEDDADVREREAGTKDEDMEKESKPEVAPQPAQTSNAPTDWFAAATAGTSLPSSSLRVGRTKTSRNHIPRPAARSRLKFSAVYEEEDDSMDPEEEARRKERAALEEAANKMPVFNIPAGFTFAKPDTKPLEQDLTNAKEPPISSLPFSFAKPAPVPEPSKAESSQSRKENAEGSTLSSERPAEPSTVPSFAPRSLADAPPLGSSEPTKEPPTTPAGVPNFFAKSALLSKPLEVPSTPPLTFGTPSSSSTSVFNVAQSSSQAPGPVKDKENPFWEGDSKKESAAPEIQVTPPTTSGFSFGAPATTQPAAATAFSFAKPEATATTGGFSFGKQTETAAAAPTTAETPSAPAVEPSKPLFGTQPPAPTTQQSQPPSSEAKPESSSVPNFFGSTASKPFDGFKSQEPAAPPASTSFSFGSSAASSTTASSTSAEPAKPLFGTSAADPPKPLFGATSTEPPKPLFGATAPAEPPKSLFGGAPAEAPKPLFGSGALEAPKPTLPSSSSSPFSFGAPAKDTAPKASPFTFGAAPSTPPTHPTTNGFSFKTDAPAASPSPVPFTFGSSAPSPAPAADKPFTFGAPAAAPPIQRPTTPKNNEQEFRMEESPTREMQANGASKPTLSFSFGQSANGSSTLFGGSTSGAPSPAPTSATPFSFGATTASNPFASSAKPEEPKPFSFGTPASTPTTTASPFSFGPSKSTGGEPARPNTTGSFSFGATSTPTSTAAPFSFGTGAAAAPNPFAPSQPTSAPSSPSTFNQPSPFSFAAPLPATSSSTPFTFGSQPASPAGSNSGLPATGGFGTATNGAFGATAAPSSPFNPPAQLAPSTSSGGTLFTIGAAPAPAAGRQIKKLPTRRAGAKR
ncbi:hypothetical protein CC1G_05170 [Coprinopsis cinerea okayama7|uniref:Uncharacterized protein n=1 Tax=Coprinopsis cinerea (strain Okayama-7 / 130 / ATCC MYA-4618 / FGSC 9003) TaxID=240176 RepID=A8NG43_COPC7|nr:hypothetical protein CC1G_05170 [Coprinopsis cinerea okayama7\|eukprot:XP_001833470.2 hypothetical protein CC1G_05170 [Coprinopsis cinerea okayama7\